jgi:hypothetical protein
VRLEVHAADRATGTPLFTATTSLFVKGHGGFGGERGPRAERADPPDRAPDLRDDARDAAGADAALAPRGQRSERDPPRPEVAARAGFRAPILSGLNTLGFACRALVHAVAGGAPSGCARSRAASRARATTAMRSPPRSGPATTWRDRAATAMRVPRREPGWRGPDRARPAPRTTDDDRAGEPADPASVTRAGTASHSWKRLEHQTLR